MRRLAIRFGALALLAGAVSLSGCAVSSYHLSDDYGRAYGQHIAAQIADPDARYKGDPDPASDGKRAALAQTKYESGSVTPPATATTSNAAGGGGGGGR